MYAKYCEARNKKGVTDYEVAKYCGFQPSTLSDWKAGRCQPKFEKLVKIADYLGVPIEIFAEAIRQER